jgi:quercetin dioxygenase-like cupin family protein
MPSTAIIRGADEGEAIWFNNELFTFKVTSAESGGAMTLWEEVGQRGKRTPLHLHPEVDETFFVIEGEIHVFVDGQSVAVGAGGTAAVLRGTPHAVLVSSETARVLTIVTPGSEALERFFHEAGDPAPSRTIPPMTPTPIARIQAAAQRTGSVVLLGPPPFKDA